MRNNYLILICALVVFTVLQMAVTTHAIAINPVPKDSTSIIYFKDSRPNKPKFDIKIASKDFESFMRKIAAVKPTASLTKPTSNSSNKGNTALEITQKPIDNVRIYPNPVSTQLNVAYTLSKENLVTVKILDVLGNEVATLLSQKVSAGEQLNTFNLTTKLNSGLYFVRIVSGSESIIKRISVL